MSKYGWLACIIVIIFVLCACVFCLLLSLVGIASYSYLVPTFTGNLPVLTFETTHPTPSPIIIRPTQSVVTAPPTSLLTPTSPQNEISTLVPVITPPSLLVPTDTLYILENTFIPIKDPIKLARQLLNLDDISPTVAPPKSFYEIGVRQSFWAGSGDTENYRIQATLRYVTEHVYFWIENGINYRQRDLETLANDFENNIYPTNRAFFGSEWTPGVDGDPHIYIVYCRGIGDNVAGYYSSADEYPRQINRFSNVHEMFFINADNSPLDDESTLGTLAHEFQHMIHWYQDQNETNWMAEGFSELAALLNHYYIGGFDGLYISQPDLQLNDWPDETREDTTPHYGESFLFVTYFLDRFGEAATKALVANQENDMNSVDITLRQIDATDPLTGQTITADSFFLDWVITNFLMDRRVGDGRYTYTSYRGAPRAEPTESFASCPFATTTRDVHQYAVDYIRFTCPGSYSLHFEGSIKTSLLPQNPHSGKYAFWANKNDESDTTLTQSFDLSQVRGPITLSYWTWYDIENGWDYVYLETSPDGENWKILTTPSGTSDDPQGNSYGWGYTGFSGGGKRPVWIQEFVDLSHFAGQELYLRFQYITDSNVTGEGFLLDDLSIPEIGYSTDFETGDAGWQAAGWVRIQNVLPQNYGLALISMGDNPRIEYITLNPDITADIPFTIGGDVDNVVLVVSATTRFTRQLAPYRFSLSKP